jgi:hypothetical protein
MTLSLFLLVLALVFLALATYKLPEPPHLAYGWAGVFLLALVELTGHGGSWLHW